MLENKSDEDIDADVLNEPEIKLDENEIKKGKNIKKLLYRVINWHIANIII